MNLPQLLRRLEQAAHGRDSRGVRQTLATLAENGGWASDVNAFISRMNGSDKDFTNSIRFPIGTAGTVEIVGDVMQGGTGTTVGFGTFGNLDAASGKAVPFAASEFATVGFPKPSSIWLLQESSGTAADSVGTTTLTAATVSYQTSVSGWTRKSISWAAGGVNGLANTTDTNIPDVSTTAFSMLVYVAITATPGADACLLVLGSQTRVIVTAAGVYKIIAGGGSTTATGSAAIGTVVRPVLLKCDGPNSIEKIYTDQETITPTFSAMASSKQVLYKGSVETSPAVSALWGAAWFGAAAQMSDATVRSMFRALGWTTAW